MSEIVIVLLLIVPMVAIIVMLSNANKKRKNRERTKIHDYITGVIRQTGIENSYQQQLVHQTIVIDELNKKLLVIDHKETDFSYEVINLEHLRDTRIISDKYSFRSDNKSNRQETITTRIGVSLLPEKAGTECVLTFYDHIAHNIHQVPDFEKEAHRLKSRIDDVRSNQLSVVQ
ncbi:hypothetical protein [Chitinophaga sp. S165]|uniref:hypothetical protein n=1 Tax=Chitinophaga sp. S165 TaxID=2135462 RepID=UPI000D818813|nr:hypothetical protein [Chitinophaga sp. S165]PWV55716.1 hypothetical protein C7475_101222 [Chitinophaga sp. S165]